MPRRATILKSRSAFTLIELLVVITIIGILIALLLPAVQAAREAARRAQCINNLKQLSLAVIHYESQFNSFPPSSYHNCCAPGSGQSGWPAATANFSNWVILTLPFLEQQALYNQYNHDRPGSDAVNSTSRGTVLAAMRCPSESNFDVLGTAFSGNWARGNYGANAGTGFYQTWSSRPSWFDTWPNKPAAGKESKGIMGLNSALTAGGVRDGLSNTVLLDEIRVGTTPGDMRGTWALGGPGASATSAHGNIYGDASGPNPCNSLADDMSSYCTDDTTNCMGCCTGNWGQGAARSQHAGMVHAAMGDGSVHGFTDFIAGNVWEAIHTAQGKEVFATGF